MQIPHEGDSLKVNFTGSKFKKKKNHFHIFPECLVWNNPLNFFLTQVSMGLGCWNSASVIKLRDITAITATVPLQTYLAAVHYDQPFTDRPHWQRHIVYKQCKCAFLITHNELDPMTSASFEYRISHNRLQCPLMLDLARTVGDRAHM